MSMFRAMSLLVTRSNVMMTRGVMSPSSSSSLLFSRSLPVLSRDFSSAMKEEDDKKKKTKKKKTKVEGAPKRPLSAYIFFTADERMKVMAEKPDLTGPEIIKEMGSRWKLLSDEDKVPYEARAAVDRARYEKEKEEFLASAISKPKRPKTAYVYFCVDIRKSIVEEMSGISSKEVLKEMATRWRSLSDEDKIPYEKKAAMDKTRFLNEKAAFEMTQENE